MSPRWYTLHTLAVVAVACIYAADWRDAVCRAGLLAPAFIPAMEPDDAGYRVASAVALAVLAGLAPLGWWWAPLVLVWAVVGRVDPGNSVEIDP